MVNYRISPQAQADLYRIWIYGLEHWGIDKADQYQANFVERFEQLAAQPFLYAVIDGIGKGYRRSVCGTDSIFYRIKGFGESVDAIHVAGNINFLERKVFNALLYRAGQQGHEVAEYNVKIKDICEDAGFNSNDWVKVKCDHVVNYYPNRVGVLVR